MINQEQWNQFVKHNKGSFLQSWQWGELQESMNRKIWHVETNDLKGLVVKHGIRLGKNYLYCPHGPVGQGNIGEFLEKVKSIALKEKSIFFRLESRNNLSFKKLGFIKSINDIQFRQTLILDISKDKDELLNQMHKKTRYNIRLAKKRGIEIIQSNDKESLNVFLKILKKTSQRDNFYLHPDKYYENILNTLKNNARLFLAKYKDKIIAANLMYFFNDTAIYSHGASDYKYRQLMAPYLLQWESILKAKQMNLKYYDFWGIDDNKWPGVTRFKKGFLPRRQAGNGKEINYPGAYDLVYKNFWYWAYKTGRKVL